MNDNKPARRSLLRLSLRDLLWAMVVVGLGLGWWVEYRAARTLTRRLAEYEISAFMEFREHQMAALKLDAVEAKLRETGFRWEYRRGYRSDGKPYVFIAEDSSPPATHN